MNETQEIHCDCSVTYEESKRTTAMLRERKRLAQQQAAYFDPAVIERLHKAQEQIRKGLS